VSVNAKVAFDAALLPNLYRLGSVARRGVHPLDGDERAAPVVLGV
jgi:hypothetical protein